MKLNEDLCMSNKLAACCFVIRHPLHVVRGRKSSKNEVLYYYYTPSGVSHMICGSHVLE
jgi:hypothetical protein